MKRLMHGVKTPLGERIAASKFDYIVFKVLQRTPTISSEQSLESMKEL